MEIRQTKYSGNSFWSNLIYHHRTASGFAPDAILVPFEPDTVNGPYPMVQGERIWFKWVGADSGLLGGNPDDVDFSVLGAGLNGVSQNVSDFVFYDSDGNIIANDITYQGSEWMGTDYYGVASISYAFVDGQTYYMSFLPPLTGDFSIIVYWD